MPQIELMPTKGGWIFKAQKIKDCLDAVFAKNVALLQPGEVAYTLNNPKATVLVPGLLSMDYIYKSTNGVANKQPLTVGVVWLWEEIGFLRTCKQIHREGSEILYVSFTS
ncbi:hypothetical protein LTR11_004371 [Exophiala xenobiotica]|nr:hypothetical protein LTR11_004371 [Exophiala xenobiotica]